MRAFAEKRKPSRPPKTPDLPEKRSESTGKTGDLSLLLALSLTHGSTGARGGIAAAAPPPPVQRACACGGRCPRCQARRDADEPAQASDDGVDGGVPAIVGEVARAPGQPLDASTRGFMEPRFGQDFGHVHVHTDARANQAASAIDARAFTMGRHIAFRTGEYAPWTDAGRRLLAHELTHVVQQRAGVRLKGGIGQAGDAYERQADAVAEAVIAGRVTQFASQAQPASGEVTVQRQQTPGGQDDPKKAGGPGCQVVYQNNTFKVNSATKPADVPTMTQYLNLLIVPKKKITKWEILPNAPGQKLTQDRWSALGDILYQAVNGMVPGDLPWGSETDLVVKLVNEQNSTRVTIRVSCEGKASIQPIDKAASIESPSDVKAVLKDEFHILEVKDEDVPWKPEELDKVLAAFRLLPPEDRAVVAGIRLVRRSKIDGGENAHFAHGLLGGTSSLVVGDTTFTMSKAGGEVDAVQFVGGTQNVVPRSVQTIIHEVGHGVAHKAKHEAEARTSAGIAAGAAEQKKLDAAGTSTKTTLESLRAEGEVNAGRLEQTDAMIPAETLSVFGNAADAAAKAYTEALAATEKGGVDPEKLEALKVAENVMRALLDKRATGSLLESYKTWLAAASSFRADLPQLAQAQAEWARTAVDLIYAGLRTKRVQRFVEAVGETRPFTPYADQNWPQRPGEFFAEAYSLFLTDREFVETNYPVIFKFFESGEYR